MPGSPLAEQINHAGADKGSRQERQHQNGECQPRRASDSCRASAENTEHGDGAWQAAAESLPTAPSRSTGLTPSPAGPPAPQTSAADAIADEIAYRMCPPSNCPAGMRFSEVTNSPTQLAIRMGWGIRLSMRRHPGKPRSKDTVQQRDRQWLAKLDQRRSRSGTGGPGEQEAQDRGGKRHQVSGNRTGDAHFDQRPAGGNARTDPDHRSCGSTQRWSGQDVGPGSLEFHGAGR